MNDTISTEQMTGQISCTLIDKKTGKSVSLFENHNTSTYSAADALASMYAGKVNLVPAYVGFVYSSLSDLDPESELIGRSTTIETLSGVDHINVQKARFSVSPSLSSTDFMYDGNKVTFVANTFTGGSQNNYLFDFSKEGAMGSSATIYAVVLLSSDLSKILAISSMKDAGLYKEKPENYEIAITWSITFK